MVEQARAAPSKREAGHTTHVWIAVATAMHAALLAALVLTPVHRSTHVVAAPAAPVAAEAAEITITLEAVAAERGESATASASTSASASAEATPAAGSLSPSSSPSSPSPATTARATAPDRGAPTPSAASSADATSAFIGAERPPGGASSASPNGGAPSGVSAIPFTTAELGIGGQNPFLPRAEEKPPTSGPDAPGARAMRGTGLEHDRKLGLGPEGPAVRALSDATTASLAPLRGRALFVVRTSADGFVSGIDLVDSEGGAGWLDAGRVAFESLRGKKIAVPRGANAMNMHIEVSSEMKLPNGQSAPVSLRRGPNDMPEMLIPDVSNIGAKPRRVVHARAVGTELL